MEVLYFHFVSIQNQNKMTQYNNLNVTLPNSQIKRSKLEIKNGTEVNFKIPSGVVSDSNDDNKFPHKILLTNKHVFEDS